MVYEAWVIEECFNVWKLHILDAFNQSSFVELLFFAFEIVLMKSASLQSVDAYGTPILQGQRLTSHKYKL